MSKPHVTFLAVALLPLCPGTAVAESTARTWNEENLAAVRLSFPDPPVHARNLFHISVAMWDAWAAYDATAAGYFHREEAQAPDGSTVKAARQEAISFAAYRVLVQRYVTHKHPNTALINAETSRDAFRARMISLGYDPDATTTVGDTPAAVGNRVAATIINHVLGDGSNELGGYTDGTYEPQNEPLILARDGAIMDHPNRWQPLEFVEAFSQTGQPLDFTTQEFLGPHWGSVWPFALSRQEGEIVYFDPGLPPQLGGVQDMEFKDGSVEVIRYSSLLDPTKAPTIDCSPASAGNNTLGQNDGTGYPLNPVTGEPYEDNMVNEADFGRSIAEFWADGPDSETPPGHWNAIANDMVDHPEFERRFAGEGEEIDALEWDVKMYFALNAAVHDAAVAAWGCKRQYDYVRPISAIRYMGGKGQSTDFSDFSTFHPEGLPLVPGLVEVVTFASIQPGERHQHLGLGAIGKIAIYSWKGEPEDPETESSGVDWILAESWFPYQRDTFVTPAFAGYISGHSTFSRAAAEVLVRMTGSEFFPGGLAVHHISAGSLEFEDGPSEDVELQWATFYDAADQAGISRLYGGIHVPVDDGPGRVVGAKCGIGAWNLASKYFDGSVLTEKPKMTITRLSPSVVRLDWTQFRGLFYRVQRGSGLDNLDDVTTSERATNDRRGTLLLVPFPQPKQEFFRILQSAN